MMIESRLGALRRCSCGRPKGTRVQANQRPASGGWNTLCMRMAGLDSQGFQDVCDRQYRIALMQGLRIVEI